MGKIVTLYLTDEETIELKKFCDENQCTQYSALKTALKELLSKPVQEKEEAPLVDLKEESPESEITENGSRGDEKPEEKRETESGTQSLRSLLKRLAQPG